MADDFGIQTAFHVICILLNIKSYICINIAVLPNVVVSIKLPQSPKEMAMLKLHPFALLRRYQDYLQFRRHYRHLLSLDARLLEDMGLTRQMIRQQGRRLYRCGRD